MQCVKLRSVMGSYLNIHLNLFPIYVLLLPLSHGRPSAKVRETREQLQKSHRQQFRDKWYQLSNTSPSTINSVSNAYSSVVYSSNIQPISHIQNTDQQVSTVTTTAAAAEKFPREEATPMRATGSHSDTLENTHHPASQPSTTEHMDVGLEKADAHAEGFPHAAPSTAAPQSSATTRPAVESTNNGQGDSWHANLGSTQKDDGIISTDRHASAIEKRATSAESQVTEEKATNSVVEDNLVETDGQFGSQQQLNNFRQNILKSLGHSENGLEDIPANVSLSTSHTDTLTKSIVPNTACQANTLYNITKEEYLQAYTEYMVNVKMRRLANRDLIGVKDRRRKAVTIAKTYHDNGTDTFCSSYTPTMEGTDVRILRVVVNLPAMCQVTGHLSNSTDLPDLQELAELAAVTSWSVRSRTSSPFIATAIRSRDTVDSHEPSSASQTAQHHHRRHASHHGSSLRVVTKEFMKPSYEAQIKRRSRRAAVNEPSTLRSFNHKRDSGRGRECANTRHGKTCCRRSLKIKFSDLGISDVILEPQEFDAHVCDGGCNARRVAYASTHAMYQHILHQTKGKKFAPRPCCVPTALSELDVLHVDPNGNRNGRPKLIVTILKDAIVKECGCS